MGRADLGQCIKYLCERPPAGDTAYCREHGEALTKGLDQVVADQKERGAAMDAGRCTTPGCTKQNEPGYTICRDCRKRLSPAPTSPTVRIAPSLAEVRQARRGVARDIEKRKEELAAHLAEVFPDCDFVVRVAFEMRPGLDADRRRDAAAKIHAAGVVSEPCQCLQWEDWAQTIVGARGFGEAYRTLRDRVTSVLGTAQKTTADAHQVGRDALAVTRAAQQDAENARKAERSADGRLRQAQSLLRRCYCGRPDPDPDYPRDRDKYLGRT